MNVASVMSLLQPQTTPSHVAGERNNYNEIGKNPNFGSAYKVDLSPEAISLLSAGSQDIENIFAVNAAEGGGAFSDDGYEIEGLSQKDQARLKELDVKIDSLFEKSETKALSKDEESQLNKLLQESDKILFEHELKNTPGLSEESRKTARGLYQQIGDIFSKYNSEQDLSTGDSDTVEKLTSRLNEIMGVNDEGESLEKIQTILGKGELAALSSEIKSQAQKIDAEIVKLLNKEDVSEEENKKLDSLFGQLEKLFEG